MVAVQIHQACHRAQRHTLLAEIVVLGRDVVRGFIVIAHIER